MLPTLTPPGLPRPLLKLARRLLLGVVTCQTNKRSNGIYAKQLRLLFLEDQRGQVDVYRLSPVGLPEYFDRVPCCGHSGPTVSWLCHICVIWAHHCQRDAAPGTLTGADKQRVKKRHAQPAPSILQGKPSIPD